MLNSRNLASVLIASLAGVGVAAADIPMAQFGIITDIHHCNMPNSSTRYYSAALPKTQHFVNTMNSLGAGFVIELGDYVDRLVDNKDPVVNLGEVESIFTSFNGPTYHVLGNHDFDNCTREQFFGHTVNTGIPQGQTYFSYDFNGVHCVVLDADYTVAEPHRPFDLQEPGQTWWTWQDAWVPQEELNWLAADLAASDLPTLVFSHQLLNREDTQDHTIKNASVVRSILEADGDTLGVFSGHDHAGDYAEINGIHYFVLEGNVEMGTDPIADNQFSFIELYDAGMSGGHQMYDLHVNGYGFQDSYQVIVPEPASLACLLLGTAAFARRRSL